MIFKTIIYTIICLLALVGAFAVFGGVRQWRQSKRYTSGLEKDIAEWERLNARMRKREEGTDAKGN